MFPLAISAESDVPVGNIVATSASLIEYATGNAFFTLSKPATTKLG